MPSKSKPSAYHLEVLVKSAWGNRGLIDRFIDFGWIDEGWRGNIAAPLNDAGKAAQKAAKEAKRHANLK